MATLRRAMWRAVRLATGTASFAVRVAIMTVALALRAARIATLAIFQLLLLLLLLPIVMGKKALPPLRLRVSERMPASVDERLRPILRLVDALFKARRATEDASSSFEVTILEVSLDPPETSSLDSSHPDAPLPADSDPERPLEQDYARPTMSSSQRALGVSTKQPSHATQRRLLKQLQSQNSPEPESSSGLVSALARFMRFAARDAPPDAVLLASSHDPHDARLAYTVSLDHAAPAIVLTCLYSPPGALLFAVLAPAPSATLAFQGLPYPVPAALLAPALRLLARPHPSLAAALARFPSYPLILCGHSLAAGVAALVGLLLAHPAPSGSGFVTRRPLPPGRALHVFAYGPPATLCPALRARSRSLITTLVYGADALPSLNLTTLGALLPPGDVFAVYLRKSPNRRLLLTHVADVEGRFSAPRLAWAMLADHRAARYAAALSALDFRIILDAHPQGEKSPGGEIRNVVPGLTAHLVIARILPRGA